MSEIPAPLTPAPAPAPEMSETITAAVADPIKHAPVPQNPTTYNEILLREAQIQTARAEVRKKIAEDESAASFAPPRVRTLDVALTEPREPLQWRVQDLLVKGHNVNKVATYKVGKTVMDINLTRSLVDGVPFLDEYDVVRVDGRVGIFNYEVSDVQYESWLERHPIVNKNKVVPISLRGQNVYIQTDAGAEWAVNTLKAMEVEVWLVDPFSAAFLGNPNAADDVQDFLRRLDQIKKEAGVSELVLTTHTGHLSEADASGRSSNERTSGSSRLMGWADAFWYYTKNNEEERFLRALGRDVDVEEFQVGFEKSNLYLSVLARRSRGSAHVDGMKEKILAYVDTHPGISANTLADGVGSTTARIKSVRRELINDGLLVVTPGPRNSELHNLSPEARLAQLVRAGKLLV